MVTILACSPKPKSKFGDFWREVVILLEWHLTLWYMKMLRPRQEHWCTEASALADSGANGSPSQCQPTAHQRHVVDDNVRDGCSERGAKSRWS
jgi:hypothetical protein